MRLRDAERRARAFLAESWPELAEWNFDIALEQDGERCRSWSFGIRPDQEDPAYDENPDGYVGYVHADGTIEGLY